MTRQNPMGEFRRNESCVKRTELKYKPPRLTFLSTTLQLQADKSPDSTGTQSSFHWIHLESTFWKNPHYKDLHFGITSGEAPKSMREFNT